MIRHVPVLGEDFTNEEVAQAFATAGGLVGPTAGNGDAKHAGSVLGKGWPFKTSNDPDQISAWFDGYPERRVMLHCGASGVVAFDYDKMHVPLPEPLARAEREVPTATQYTRWNAATPPDQQRRHIVYGKPDRRIGNGGGALGCTWGEVRGQNGIIIVGGPGRVWLPDGPIAPMSDYLDAALPDSEDGEAEASTAEVAEFFERCHDGVRPAMAVGPARAYAKKVAEGHPRHPVMFTLIQQACRETHCGLYAAKLAHDALLEEWTRTRTVGEVRSTPRAWAHEFAAMWAYGVGQVAGKPVEEVLPRLGPAALDALLPAETTSNAHATTQPPSAASAPYQLPADFWEARPVLRHIRQAARARFCGPDAVLGAALARQSSYLHPADVVDLGLGDGAPMTIFAIPLGSPAAGKGRAMRCAAELLPAPDHLLDFRERSLGSGEGLVEAFYGVVSPDPDTDGKVKGPKVHKQVRDNVLFVLDEGEALVKMITQRNGTTIAQTIRSAWSGENIGQANASAERDRQLNRGDYALGLIVAFQPDTIGPLFDPAQVGGGTPHRFLFMSALDPHAPDQPPEWPGPLVLPQPALPPDVGALHRVNPTGPNTYTLADEAVRAEIRATRLAILRGEHAVSEQDTHATQYRGRIAAHLARWDGRIEVTGEDWELAGMVMATSAAVRDAAIEYGVAQRRAEAEARTTSHVERATRAAISTAEAMDQREAERLERVSAKFGRKVREATAGVAHRGLKDMAGSKYRDLLGAAIETAAERGWIERRADGKYYPGGNAREVPDAWGGGGGRGGAPPEPSRARLRGVIFLYVSMQVRASTAVAVTARHGFARNTGAPLPPLPP